MDSPYKGISNSPIYLTGGQTTLITIVIFFFCFMLVAFFFLYDHWYLPRSRRHHSRNHHPTLVFFAIYPSATASRGLNPAVVKSLPVFTFSEATHSDPIDCAVCLSEFEEGESGRVLPGCKHAFHVECIDMWFHSHYTCPLSRTLVEPLAESAMTVEEQVAITISSELVSATEPDSSSGSGSSSMSPMSRMLALTRMLSRDRRTSSSSFAGAPPPSPSSSCRIVMTELDMSGEEKRLSDFRHVDVP